GEPLILGEKTAAPASKPPVSDAPKSNLYPEEVATQTPKPNGQPKTAPKAEVKGSAPVVNTGLPPDQWPKSNTFFGPAPLSDSMQKALQQIQEGGVTPLGRARKGMPFDKRGQSAPDGPLSPNPRHGPYGENPTGGFQRPYPGQTSHPKNPLKTFQQGRINILERLQAILGDDAGPLGTADDVKAGFGANPRRGYVAPEAPEPLTTPPTTAEAPKKPFVPGPAGVVPDEPSPWEHYIDNLEEPKYPRSGGEPNFGFGLEEAPEIRGSHGITEDHINPRSFEGRVVGLEQLARRMGSGLRGALTPDFKGAAKGVEAGPLGRAGKAMFSGPIPNALWALAATNALHEEGLGWGTSIGLGLGLPTALTGLSAIKMSNAALEASSLARGLNNAGKVARFTGGRLLPGVGGLLAGNEAGDNWESFLRNALEGKDWDHVFDPRPEEESHLGSQVAGSLIGGGLGLIPGIGQLLGGAQIASEGVIDPLTERWSATGNARWGPMMKPSVRKYLKENPGWRLGDAQDAEPWSLIPPAYAGEEDEPVYIEGVKILPPEPSPTPEPTLPEPSYLSARDFAKANLSHLHPYFGDPFEYGMRLNRITDDLQKSYHLSKPAIARLYAELSGDTLPEQWLDSNSTVGGKRGTSSGRIF
ncbi:MAG TPA: hypothetical protein VEI97_10235, partial [bacterium]|nr:hypothetical protein [bacterium]